MKITAVSVGTRGDVQPLVELGMEMIRRGHDFSVMAYEAFRPLCEEKKVPYIHMDGEADRLMQLLVTDYRTSMDFMSGCMTLYKENPRFMDQVEEAVRGSDVVMYGTCSGLVRHVCDYLHIPCIRYFYSPFDRTDMYSLYDVRHNCPAVGRSYGMIEPGMNMLTLLTGNAWRRKKGMKSWSLFSDYRRQNGKPILTIYPTTKVFMPLDPAWGKHINVPGYFFHPEEDAASFVPSKALEEFLAAGEKPIFVCFGKAKSPEMAKLQRMTVQVIETLGIRAIVQGDMLELKASPDQKKLQDRNASPDQKKPQDRNTSPDQEALPETIFPIGNIPYSYIFPKVKGVIHHGGNTTCGLALWAGVPALTLPLALDQWFYGRSIAENGCGPQPLYWRKKLPTKEELTGAIRSLAEEDYSEGLKKAAAIVRNENGCQFAADLIERWDWNQYRRTGEKSR